VPLEPPGLDLAVLDRLRQHDLECPLAEPQLGQVLRVGEQAGGLGVGQQPVAPVAVPVQLLLPRDHLRAQAFVRLAGRVQPLARRYSVSADRRWLDPR
jgi:hypothetical protein